MEHEIALVCLGLSLGILVGGVMAYWILTARRYQEISDAENRVLREVAEGTYNGALEYFDEYEKVRRQGEDSPIAVTGGGSFGPEIPEEDHGHGKMPTVRRPMRDV